ncbi:MAG TPA: PEP-CTERM sorting domain-containing protein [Chromatiales bacterium]|nr:PEP-CTERM sorting domain-containing protein [Chromatiales bacterium]
MWNLFRRMDAGRFVVPGVLVFFLAGILAISPADAVKASSINLLVPAYAYPTATSQMWPSLTRAAESLKGRAAAILNPNSGPGTAVDSNYAQAIAGFRNAGGRVYGYVATTYGQRDAAEVKQEVDRYYSFYPALVDGIFFDEMANDLAKTGYYRQLRDHVKSKQPEALVIGNPGTSYLNDSSNGATGFDADDYAASADVLVSFEDDEAAYRNHYRAPDWGPQSSDHIAHIVHSTGTDWEQELLDLAAARGAGWVYFTDDVEPNPYDEKPVYLDAEVAAIAAYNTPVPLPAGLPLFLSGLGLVGLWKRLRHRSTG